VNRRTFLGTSLLVLPGTAGAAPASDVQDRRLLNRLELWANYAGRTQNLVARYTLIRRSSLLNEPLTITGTLVFIAPDRLVFRDDGMTGSTTELSAGLMTIVASQADSADKLQLSAATHPAAQWLGQRLVRTFAPADGAALIAGCRTHVPKGRGYKLDLMPPRGSAVRKALRTVTLTLDPVAGAVTGIHISEAQGDVVVISLTDHRQNVDEGALNAALGQREQRPPPDSPKNPKP
jgi:hypothetical protein